MMLSAHKERALELNRDVAAGVSSAGVWLWNREAVPGTARSHMILLPVSYEEALGRAALQQIQSKMVRNHFCSLPCVCWPMRPSMQAFALQCCACTPPSCWAPKADALACKLVFCHAGHPGGCGALHAAKHRRHRAAPRGAGARLDTAPAIWHSA